jgi:predicted pyridoxine 5'-phosphate oxidase superfamily flavin-nucleotide-binding protein
MDERAFYHHGMLALQDAAGGRELADLLQQKVRRDAFTDDDRAFIEAAGFFFIATSYDDRPDCSFKAGEPGFVRVTGPNTLEFPDYDGNLMFRTLGNIAMNPNVGLLFIRFGPGPKRVRINGHATLVSEPGRLASHHGAKAVIEVACADIYPNCPRYIPDVSGSPDLPGGKLSAYVPRPGHTPPIPEWKTYPFVTPLLPDTDPHKREIIATRPPTPTPASRTEEP